MRRHSLLLVVLACLVSATAAEGQREPGCPWPGPPRFLTDRPSPPDSARVQLPGVAVKLCYSRPSARGRVVMGELVPFGRPWRTGANEPTVLMVPAAVEVAGVPLNAGSYILLTIPGADAWTIILNSTSGTTPEQQLSNLQELGRGSVPVTRTADFVEAFTVRGQNGDGDGRGSLVLEWEHTRVEIPVSLPGARSGTG